MLQHHYGHSHEAIATYETEEIHNFYQSVVIQRVAELSKKARNDADFHADVCCVALNHLPPKYIRHSVDMRFFMSPDEAREIDLKVDEAVKFALDFVEGRQR